MPDILARKEAIATKITQGRRDPIFLFFVALLLFLLASATYGGLLLLVNTQISARDELVFQIGEKGKNLRPELIEQIILLERRLKNINALINQHIFASNIFRVIEADTHSQVRFTSFNFQPESFKVDMSGETVNYSVLSQQVNILERDPLIEKVDFGGLALSGNGLLGFKVTIEIRSNLLQSRQETVKNNPLPPSQ